MSQFYEQNNLAIVLIIAGFTLPGLEIISNALKALANNQSSLTGASLTILGGLIYTIFSLPLITNKPSSSSSSSNHNHRLVKILPLILGLILLLGIKFFFTNSMLENDNFNDPSAWYIFLSEIIPGLGKRLILLIGLAQDPANSALSRALTPFYKSEISIVKAKKD